MVNFSAVRAGIAALTGRDPTADRLQKIFREAKLIHAGISFDQIGMGDSSLINALSDAFDQASILFPSRQ